MRRVIASVVVIAPCMATAWGQSLDDRWADFADATAERLAVPGLAVSNDDHEVDLGWGDLDLDGFVDLVVVRKQPFTTPGRRTNVLLMNDHGVLRDRTAAYASAADVLDDQGFLTPTNDRDVVLADVDMDGWLDVVTATTFGDGLPKHVGHPRVYRNLGGAFAWGGLRYEAARIPQLLHALTGQAFNPRFAEVGAGDVEGDGAPDLYFVDHDTGITPNSTEPPGVDLDDRLLMNDGAGWFVDETAARLAPPMLQGSFVASVEVADMNGDGLDDIVRSKGRPEQLVSVTYNDPLNPGTFKIYDAWDNGTSLPYHVAAGDLDADGRLDLVSIDEATDGYRRNLGNDPLGRVNFGPLEFFQFLSGGDDGLGGNVLLADLDEDDRPEVLVCDVHEDVVSYGRRFHLYRNAGVGPSGLVLREERQFLQEAHAGWLGAVGLTAELLADTFDVAVFDVDRDGDQDMVLGRRAGMVVLDNRRILYQHDLGFAGPGPATPARLEIHGGDLSAGTAATMRIGPLAPNAPVIVLIGLQIVPTFAWQVQAPLLPVPPLLALVLNAPPSGGTLEGPVLGGGGPIAVIIQGIVQDPAAPTPQGWYATNALYVLFKP